MIYSEPGSYNGTQTTGKLESISQVSSKMDSEIAHKEARLAELEARLAELEAYQANPWDSAHPPSGSSIPDSPDLASLLEARERRFKPKTPFEDFEAEMAAKEARLKAIDEAKQTNQGTNKNTTIKTDTATNTETNADTATNGSTIGGGNTGSSPNTRTSTGASQGVQ
ncbi:hypothetical protein I316_00112 [Kwoniella heveanensis BCC8398]|uniref:Uncharacterized protein n=1 Tax=Kwoniella heveanensis BCC8398 TaxID=1296120 RepID=A0A1B9H3Q6_9TREE|nr:hypothetical protein I316_00112 [Kwoniella heveanensis BCC8398]